jgi:hypothetical protein
MSLKALQKGGKFMGDLEYGYRQGLVQDPLSLTGPRHLGYYISRSAGNVGRLVGDARMGFERGIQMLPRQIIAERFPNASSVIKAITPDMIALKDITPDTQAYHTAFDVGQWGLTPQAKMAAVAAGVAVPMWTLGAAGLLADKATRKFKGKNKASV